MDRRNFIRGLLVSASVGAGTALVRLAKPEEVTGLVAGEQTLIAQPGNRQHVPALEGISSEVYIRKVWQGQEVYVPIGYIREITIGSNVAELVTWDGKVDLVPGLKRGRLLFDGQRQFFDELDKVGF